MSERIKPLMDAAFVRDERLKRRLMRALDDGFKPLGMDAGWLLKLPPQAARVILADAVETRWDEQTMYQRARLVGLLKECGVW